VSVVAEAAAQPSVRRMREFAVRPDRDLGQNFLVDSNILGVIGRAAELAPEDVVLEIGGGLGVLSEYLADRVGYVHVLEIDERLRAPLEDATAARENVGLVFADAMTFPLAALEPAPGKLVANLPYGIAASVLLRSIEELPSVQSWVVMAQREVGERLAAKPGNGTYGVPSVLAQLACDVEVLRAIPRNVFRPVPNVDSVLVGLKRRPGAQAELTPQLRALVAGGFAHRRKTLAGSLARARPGAISAGIPGAVPAPGELRVRLHAALEQLGHPADVRAERLSPEDFRALDRALEGVGAPAGADRLPGAPPPG
jgi:16S rRNA (adenine1518-N6/adenine1519-N6)-dimethyltransferase